MLSHSKLNKSCEHHITQTSMLLFSPIYLHYWLRVWLKSQFKIQLHLPFTLWPCKNTIRFRPRALGTWDPGHPEGYFCMFFLAGWAWVYALRAGRRSSQLSLPKPLRASLSMEQSDPSIDPASGRAASNTRGQWQRQSDRDRAWKFAHLSLVMQKHLSALWCAEYINLNFSLLSTTNHEKCCKLSSPQKHFKCFFFFLYHLFK